MERNTIFSKTVKLLGVVAMFTAYSGTAGATALFDFNPANLGVAASSGYAGVGMSSGGIGVTVNGLVIDNDNAGGILSTSDAKVYVSSSNNLGVSSVAGDGSFMDGGSCSTNCSSSTDPDEGLLLTFSQIVNLVYINFDNFSTSGSDDFNLTVDGKLTLLDFNFNDTSPLASNSGLPGQEDEYNFSGISGTQFLFWADGSSDNFKIDRIEVPEPTTLGMLVAGVALLGAKRRGKLMK